MIAARVVDVRPGEEFDIGLSVATPSGLWTAPNDRDGYEVGIAGEYILITLRNLPLYHEGIYRFELSLDEGTPICLDIPVLLVSKPHHAAIHYN